MIFIAGATGFVGGHLVNDLISKGYKIKCLVRSAKSADALASRGVEIINGDITSAESLKGAIKAGDCVIHLVGIIEQRDKATFRSVHVEGTFNLVNEAKRSGAGFFFYQSALGADKGSWSGYLRTKAEAEDIVRESGLRNAIFRPSLIIGPWDGFTKKLLEIIKLAPVVPIPGDGRAKFQPVYIKDWIKCLNKILDDQGNYLSVYDIGGPEHITYRQIVETLSESIGRSKPVFTIPMDLMKISAAFMGIFLPSPPVTVDQLRLLEQDNICDTDVIEKHFGFKPMRFRDALGEFITKP